MTLIRKAIGLFLLAVLAGALLTGCQGSIGPEGAQGSPGPQGPQGFQGPEGATGPQGSEGLAGPIGTQGLAGPQGPQGPAGSVGPTGEGVTPKTQELWIVMGEGEIIQEVDGEEKLTGEFHRWEPSVLIANKGDTVKLNVTNPRGNAHIFALPEFDVETPRLEKRGGTTDVEFVADKAGVFQYKCALDPDEELGNCDADHKRQVGYLIVMDR